MTDFAERWNRCSIIANPLKNLPSKEITPDFRAQPKRSIDATMLKRYIKVELELDGVLSAYRVRLPKDGNGVRELPLFGSGRTMRLRFSNEEGGSFALEAGAQLEFSARKRTE